MRHPKVLQQFVYVVFTVSDSAILSVPQRSMNRCVLSGFYHGRKASAIHAAGDSGFEYAAVAAGRSFHIKDFCRFPEGFTE